MYQTGDTLKEALQAIQNNKFVLPAIQREFVWKPEQIARLFDSIMQGYPFGTFLFWKVEKPNSSKYKFYGFVRDYHERDQPHCPQLPAFHDTELTAVLDGQQRLTALSIGLSGSMAWRSPYKWKNNPNAYPVRRLCLDLLKTKAESEDGGERYCFEFLSDEQAASPDSGRCWFKVSDILEMQGGPAMVAWLNKRLPQNKVDMAYATLDELYRAVHDKHLISYYEEKSQQLEKVLNIFIRMNSGGTVLSYSDLLLSIAVAQWSKDARTEIHTLVDELNKTGDGFNLSQDFVLKAGLMLAEIGNVGFKVENFNRENMAVLEKKWPAVKKALAVAVELVASFGFNEKTLRADSAVLPIAYYVCHRGLDEKYITKAIYASDREAIRSWFIRSLLKASGIWGSGLDTLLTALRETISKDGAEAFPIEKLEEAMRHRGKSLRFSQEEIEDLVDMPYGDKRLFGMLALLFPFVDVRNNFHIDHVFPQTRFTRPKLKKAGVADDDIEDFQEMANNLPNLQLLEGAKNLEKLALMPADWIKNKFATDADRTNYCANHLLGKVPDSMAGFRAFFTARRDALRSRIVEMLAASGADGDSGASVDSGGTLPKQDEVIDSIGQHGEVSKFSEIAKDIICKMSDCEILRTASKEIRFIPVSWAKVVPENGTAWRHLSRPVSVSCWVELDNNTLSSKFEVSRMTDPALRLACVEGLRDAAFTLDTRAFREDAKYSRFYRKSRKLQDSNNEKELRAGIEELFGKAKEEFLKAEGVFQRVFAEKGVHRDRSLEVL